MGGCKRSCCPFVSNGLPIDDRLLNKLWQISKIIGNEKAGNPFDEKLLRLNEAQLDFILEKYVEDDPKRGKFFRPGRPSASEPKRQAAWEHVLMGKARDAFMARFTMSPAVLARSEALGKARASLGQRGGQPASKSQPPVFVAPKPTLPAQPRPNGQPRPRKR